MLIGDMKMEQPRRYIGVEDMRDKLGGCGRATIYRWENEGVIPPAFMVGSRRMWDEAEVDAHLAASRELQSAA